MITWLALTALTAAPPACGPVLPARLPAPSVYEGGPAQQQATLRELYESGVAYDAFLGAATARRPLWLSNSAGATVPGELLERALAVPGTWRILAVAVDGCSDSVNTIPWVARLAGLVPSIDLRIIDSDAGSTIMEAHRTPDGRPATPTLVLLDAEWSEAGCFIERPRPLQQWYDERKDTVPVRELTAQKMQWYADDAGRATLAQIVEMIEGAAAGSPVCAAATAG